MSFILDALKKSEAERLRRDAPGIADVPDKTQEKSARYWPWLIVALIVVNISVLILILVKPGRAPDTVAVTTTGAPAHEAPPAEARPAASLSEIVPQTRPSRSAAATELDPVTRAVIDIASEAADPAPPVPRFSSPPVAESYATFNDLRAQGELQLPDLHLDIHVYSSKPEDRFIFVNMSKYKERSTLDEGPAVREITPEGVILEYRGTAFLLPRE